MATITKRVNRGIEGVKRYQYWASTENNDEGNPIEAGDIFRIEESLGRPAKYIWIEAATGTELSIRFNSQLTTYPMRDPMYNYPNKPDLSSPVVSTDESLAAINIGSDEVWELDAFPVSDIQIVTFYTGSFELFVA